MAQTQSRIGVTNIPNFIPDNSGRTITQGYQSITYSTGTVSLTPTAQDQYFNFSNALTGNIALNISATYSGIAANGSSTTTNYYSQICDTVTLMITGGASPYVLTYNNNIKSTTATYSVPATVPTIIKGIFNGTEFVSTHYSASA